MSENTQQCPRCARNTSELIPVDSGMKLALEAAGEGSAFMDVCPICYNELGANVSRGARLRMEEKAKERNRHMLWKSRVNLVKKARILMVEKNFSDAAVNYEKYIRVLEMSYELQPGALTPEVFGATKRSKEITIVSSTYWDLMRIYDTTGTYRDRMVKAAHKLALFLPFSPIFPDVVKKAQAFLKTAKNPDVVRNFLKQVKANNPGCFIATSVYPYPDCAEIQQLRSFRDQTLLQTPRGTLFVKRYYKYSPYLVKHLERIPPAKWLIRSILNIFIKYHLKNS